MTAVVLPTSPGIRNAKPRLLDWSGRLVPILGGPTQTLLRLGSRFALEFTLPPIPSEPTGRRWAAALLEAKFEGAIANFVQDGFNVSAPGMPVVHGADQAGSTINLRSAQPNYAFRYGQFVSHVHDDRRYLYMVRAQAIVGGDGHVALPILPMLRVIPDDGDLLEVGRPKIQGSLIGNELAWSIDTAPYMDFGPIRIDEDA